MAITITIDTGPYPQGGFESIPCSSPATRAAFQTAAATALSTYGGFILVTRTDDPDKVSYEQLINLNKIKAVT